MLVICKVAEKVRFRISPNAMICQGKLRRMGTMLKQLSICCPEILVPVGATLSQPFISGYWTSRLQAKVEPCAPWTSMRVRGIRLFGGGLLVPEPWLTLTYHSTFVVSTLLQHSFHFCHLILAPPTFAFALVCFQSTFIGCKNASGWHGQ